MSEQVSDTAQRKADHLRINLEEDVRAKGVTSGFEAYRFVHQALPELNLAEVRTDCLVLGHALNAPLLISSMTGGVAQGRMINRNLAAAAQRIGLAMGLGSQRLAVEQADRDELYRGRH